MSYPGYIHTGHEAYPPPAYQQPAYPAQAPYPPQQAYPPQQGPYPAAQPAYPAPNSHPPLQQAAYPYPPQQAQYPAHYPGAPPAALPPPPVQAQTAIQTWGQHPPGQHPPAYVPPTTYTPQLYQGRRKALLIGCCYPGTDSQLNGCINDVMCIQYCLKKNFGFQDSNIVVLRDDRKDRDFISTRHNIMRGIYWLVADAKPGDSLFFHFSGHGSQKPDMDYDEDDGADETILPTDYKQAGQIVDDELNQHLIRPLTTGVKLHAVVDACHSGTVLDLAWRTKYRNQEWHWKGREMQSKATSGGLAIQFGACRDSQTAADTNHLSGKAYTGAATFTFIDAVEKLGTHATYDKILSRMTQKLREMSQPQKPSLPTSGGGIIGALLGAVIAPAGFSQTPVLSCNRQINLYQERMAI